MPTPYSLRNRNIDIPQAAAAEQCDEPLNEPWIFFATHSLWQQLFTYFKIINTIVKMIFKKTLPKIVLNLVRPTDLFFIINVYYE